MLIGHHMARYREEIVHHIAELVRIRSVREEGEPGKPYGPGIDRALHYMLSLGEEMGFRTANIDGYAGHAEYGEGEELVAILVHLDTVHEGEGWTFPPFGGEIHDGSIIGRGASDNKGPAVVALYALKAIRELGIPLHKRIRIIFGTNEENDMSDMDVYFSREPLPDQAFMPDACYPLFNVEMGNVNVLLSQTLDRNTEPESLRIVELSGGTPRMLVAETCMARISADPSVCGDIERLQASRHNLKAERLAPDQVALTANGTLSNPPVNAIAEMAGWISGLQCSTNADGLLAFLKDKIGHETNGESLGIRYSDEYSGETLVFLRQIVTEQDTVTATVGIRYPVTYNGDEIISFVEEQARCYGVRLDLGRHFRPVYFPPDHPLVCKLGLAYEKMTGEKPFLLQMSASTYARKLGNRGLAFGASLHGGVDNNVHRADEFVRIDDMMKHAEICLQGLYELII
ncbi:Sapep family Mn(2+)-dependent dipeptidase [Paenibacillus montanisoli]|uniref:Dipeptidase PepV n=1 Tax=Paenibacillus montanisoli TaxID=2081970 RepID=A0A328UAI0_9BACL|nr:Sapep family Mn(2+)-dependent dipeptidase [Paenibacillus montanisoli]RAP77935.1 hypothetical protein DL346_05620 [Paenibacillus montanisoli]